MDTKAERLPEQSAWMRAMRRGDFAAAWRVADAELAARAGQTCWDWPRHLQYVWTGAPVEGKRVLVRCYHGLGDTVQFIRFAALLKERASEVIVWAQPTLLPLLRGVAGVDRVLPLHDGTPDVRYDVDVEIMELAHVLRLEANRVAETVPYLRAPHGGPLLENDRLNVGVIWRAGEWDERRSVPLDLFSGLAAIPEVRLHAMQQGPRAMAWPSEWGAVCPAKNPSETAQWMEALDLIISVDSFPAHLAGALGKPIWVLLPKEADWRWMDSRDDSPWYPTMRLFRQHRAGDWTGVFDRVAAELEKQTELIRHARLRKENYEEALPGKF